jgi:hypothetical protein
LKQIRITCLREAASAMAGEIRSTKQIRMTEIEEMKLKVLEI